MHGKSGNILNTTPLAAVMDAAGHGKSGNILNTMLLAVVTGAADAWKIRKYSKYYAPCRRNGSGWGMENQEIF